MEPLRDLDEWSIRRALGEFATGITVVTTKGPYGFACQSFTSLSLNPPLVLFTVMRTSRTWPFIEENGTFTVNVLTAEQQHISETFGHSARDKFAVGTWEDSPLGNPALVGSAIWIDCEVHQVHDGGDHHIVIGRVCDIGHRQDEGTKPLVYHRGSYTRLDDPGHDADRAAMSDQRPSL
ncbi:flavin reductase family protein [Corynebacterium sp. TAE3-ERU12]|uniref:flavin reductase family protein n=1 Tax=Corynebacterium sp. TAE3-ERU12 TaxID=2849491 RepID=UPI001C447B3A|nr:flavin reductase family protein [Corynebacterium sp. TAE3-ERU12]MBV7295889.1 flavin reductase family protein [Corynebacterium sp. TAE3-ERU12]